MVETVLSSPFVQEIILPFILVFVVIFAILQKTKVLGEGKKQIDALVALAIALIVVSFGFATGIIVTLVPFLAVSAVVILVFMVLYGMTFRPEDNKGFKMNKYISGTIGGLVALGVIITLLVATGAWNYLEDQIFYDSDGGTSFVTNAILILVVLFAVGLAVFGKESKSGKD